MLKADVKAKGTHVILSEAEGSLLRCFDYPFDCAQGSLNMTNHLFVCLKFFILTKRKLLFANIYTRLSAIRTESDDNDLPF